MLCFKDTTFCSSSEQCGNTDCGRKFTDKDREDAKAWWGSYDFPVAWSDFRNDCGKFKPVDRKDERD